MRSVQFSCLLAGLGAAVIAPTGVQAAEGLDYTYLQLNVIGRDIDAFDDNRGLVKDFDDGGGFSIDGSYAFTNRFFVYGSYSDTESDVSFESPDIFPLPADTNIKRLDAGVGTMYEINNDLDLVGRLGYVDIDYGDFNFGASSDTDVNDLFDDTSDGYSVDGSLRSQLTDNLEGSIGLRYIDIQDFDNASLLGSLTWEFTPDWDLSFAIDAGDELATYQLGIRFSPTP